MKKRQFNAILAAALCISLLCGCFDATNKTPAPLDLGSQTKPASTYSSESSTAMSTRENVDKETSQSVSSSTTPQSTASSTTPQSTASSTKPQSTASSTKPQSTASSTKPQSTASSTKPQSTASSTKPQSTASSTKPQSTASSTKPQSTTSSTTTQSTSEAYQQPIIEPGGSILSNYTSKWAYNHITDKQKQLYARLYNTASNVGGYCDISDLGLSVDDIYTAYWAFDYENPQFLELGSGYKYSYTESRGVITMVGITIDYGRTSGSVPQSDFDRVAQNVLANARTLSSDYDKLKYVHDWIINNTVYLKGDTLYESEADGPVVYGKAICEGYSKAFMYFAQSMGFECVCAIGRADGVDHMWNMVKLNGQWYHVDTTWDDPVMSDGSNKLRYNYFMLSDSEIRRDHSIDTPFVLPSAPYSYA